MKNLLIYINPNKEFSTEHVDLTKIQIDNSLNFGWKKEDILLVTNFEYEYNGIKSIIVNDYEAFDQHRSTKIMAINQLFSDGIIEDDMYWFHDHDAFQIAPIDLMFEKDAAFTTHGVFDPVMWNAGSFFFKKSAKDIFIWIEEWMDKLGGTNEQSALTHLWKINYNNINDRCEMLDPSYNLGIYKIPENIKISRLPIKVAHFHPHKKHHLDMYRDILPKQLMDIFNKYGIE